MDRKVPEKILAIETSGKTLGAALLSNPAQGCPRLLGEISLDAGFRHSEVLSQACRFLVHGAGFKLGDLTGLAVSTGPGSFTGLRVGVAYARTLAQFLKVPLIGVNAFEILARQAGRDPGAQAKWVCVIIDSIGGDFYLGIFKPGSLKPAEPYRVISKKDLERKLAKLNGKKVLFSSTFTPKASDLGAIALERFAKAKAGDWKKVVPFYLRAPIAVERGQEYRKRR